jgi:hypothetical protein
VVHNWGLHLDEKIFIMIFLIIIKTMDADFELFERVYAEVYGTQLVEPTPAEEIPYGQSKCCKEWLVDVDGASVCPGCGIVDDNHVFAQREFVDSVKFRSETTRKYSRVDTYIQHLDRLSGAIKLTKAEREALTPLRAHMTGKVVSFHSLKDAMKELGLQKHYAVIPCVMAEFYGIKCLDLKQTELSTLLERFSAFDRKFRLQSVRTNSLNYFWLTRKLCEELGYPLSKYGATPDLKDQKKKGITLRLYNEIKAKE